MTSIAPAVVCGACGTAVLPDFRGFVVGHPGRELYRGTCPKCGDKVRTKIPTDMGFADGHPISIDWVSADGEWAISESPCPSEFDSKDAVYGITIFSQDFWDRACIDAQGNMTLSVMGESNGDPAHWNKMKPKDVLAEAVRRLREGYGRITGEGSQ